MFNKKNNNINLDIDLLRTYVAVADLNTFAAAATNVSRTQSAVSQQMQRLEEILGTELFVRLGRKKELTEHGLQLLSYARKILRFNDAACNSLALKSSGNSLTLGIADDIVDEMLPFFLDIITDLFPNLKIDINVKRNHALADMLKRSEVDLIISTTYSIICPQIVLRQSPTFWYYSTHTLFHADSVASLILRNDPCCYRDIMKKYLNLKAIPWRVGHEVSSLTAVKAAVEAGLGITVGPIEMMSPDLRVLGAIEGFPTLPATNYFLYCHSTTQSETAKFIFETLHNRPRFPYLQEQEALNIYAKLACEVE